MDDGIQEPTLAPSAKDVAQGVDRGQVGVFLHEWAEVDGITPERWRATVAAYCEENGIPHEIQVFADDEVTVVVNPDNCPNDEQLGRMIGSLVRFRESGG